MKILKKFLSIIMAVLMILAIPSKTFAMNVSTLNERVSNDYGHLSNYENMDRAQYKELTFDSSSDILKTGQKVIDFSWNRQLRSAAAIMENGDLYCWGYNKTGGVGNGTLENQKTPAKVLGNVKKFYNGNEKFESGDNTKAAITENGDLYCWGYNKTGGVGNGTLENQKTPVKVLGNVKKFYNGNDTKAAITENDDLYCWGDNSYGRIEDLDGAWEHQTIPLKILDNVSSFYGGYDFNAALTQKGDLYCWGHNNNGQVGNGVGITNTPVMQKNPVKVLENVKKFYITDMDTSVAITTNDDLYCWGNNAWGQVGCAETYSDIVVPVKVLENVRNYYYGYMGTSAAVTNDGDLYCWGYNQYGQVGNGIKGIKEKQYTPVKVLDNVKEFYYDAYGSTSAAITKNSDLYCWGCNIGGQIGNGTKEDQLIPIKILDNVKIFSLNNPEYGKVNAGIISTALKENGDLYRWGYNEYGHIGNGTKEDQLIPVKLLSNVLNFSETRTIIAAITMNRDLYCWGYNYCGQVGTDKYQKAPTMVLSDVKTFFGSSGNSAALTTNGDLYCWGDNRFGQIGNGIINSNESQDIPVKIIAASVLPEVEIDKQDSNDLIFKVSDRLKKQNIVALPAPLENVYINVDGIGQAYTNEDGKANIQNNSEEGAIKAKVVLSKEGYRQYIFDKIVYHKDQKLLWNSNKIYAQMTELQEGDNEKPYVSTLMCSSLDYDNDSDAMMISNDFDAMTVSKKYKHNDRWQHLSMQMNAVWNGKTPKSYIIYQKDGPSYESTDGKFSIDMGKFNYWQPVYAKLVATDGTVVEEETEFDIGAGDPIFLPSEDEGLEIIKTDSTGNLGEDVQFFSGEEVCLNLKANIKLKVEQDKVRLTIGKSTKSEIFTNEEWEDWKKLCETQPKDLNLSQWKNVVESINMDWTGNLKVDTQVYGYLEGAKKDSGDTIVTGKIVISASVDVGLQTQYTVGVIPVYAKISVGVKTAAEGKAAYNLTQKQFVKDEISIKLKVEPVLSAEAGVGVMSVATVGIKGTGSLPVEVNTNGDPDDTTVTIKGGMSFEASVLKFKYTHEIANVSKKLLPKEEWSAKNIQNLTADDFKLTERENIKRKWLGEEDSKARVMSAMSNSSLEKILENGVYSDSEMQIVDNGTTRMILWTEDDAGRSNINGSKLVYSVYDSYADTWSAPKAIADDGTADYAPTVASDSGHIYVAWQNMNKILADTASLTEAASSGEIVMSTWTEADGFSVPVAVSEKGHMSAAPVIKLDARGIPFITYLQNTEDNLLFTSGENNIMYSVVSGSSIEYKSFEKNAGLITAFDTAYTDDYEISYTVDTDNNLSTLNDREIVTQKGGTRNAMNNECMDSNVRYVNTGSSWLRFWYRDNSICMTDNSGKETIIYEDETGSLSDNFNVIHGKGNQIAIVWTRTDEDGVKQIEGIIYDNEKAVWSKSVQISDTDASVYNPKGIFQEDGSLFFIYKKDGADRTDLCALTAEPYVNLTVENAYCDEGEIVVGNSTDVCVQIKNNGTKRMDQYVIDIDGTKTQISTLLEPGEVEIVKADYAVPSDLNYRDVKVVVEADGDADSTDNSYTMQLGHPDFAINLLQNKYDFGHLIEARISNENAVVAGAVLEIKKGSRDGELVKSIDLGNLEKGAVTAVTYIWNEASENYSNDTDTLYFDVISDKQEKYKDNNYDFAVVNSLKGIEEQDVKVQSVSIQNSVSMKNGNTMQLTATVLPENAANKTLKWSSDNTSVAVVDQNGLVTAVGTGEAVITAASTDGSNISASCVVKVEKLLEDENEPDKPDDIITVPDNTTDPDDSTIPGDNVNPGGTTTTPGNSINPGGMTTIPNGGPNTGNDKPNGNEKPDSDDELEVKLLYYIVEFDANGGTKLSRKTMTLLNDDNLGILPKVQRKNYIFNGWYTQKSGGKKVNSATVLNAGTSLHAHWTKAKPAKVKISSLKSSKTGAVLVSLKKIAGVKGYEISYSTNKKFPSSSTKKAVLSSAKKTLKHLKSGKKYYVRVRAYNLDSTGKKVYGSYSAVKSIKVK